MSLVGNLHSKKTHGNFESVFIFLHVHFFFTGTFFVFSRMFFFMGIRTLVLTAQIKLKSSSSAQVKVLRSAKILISAEI